MKVVLSLTNGVARGQIGNRIESFPGARSLWVHRRKRPMAKNGLFRMGSSLDMLFSLRLISELCVNVGESPSMPTRFLLQAEAAADDKWFIIDAADQVLGRLATKVATLLSGKHKASYAPFLITGDHVVIINADKIKLTGQKLEQKIYYRHTGYPGGLKQVTAKRVLESRPERLIEDAVLGMLPKNKLRKRLAKRLRVYVGAEHPHRAQNPEVIA